MLFRSGISYVWDIGGTAGFNLVSWPEMVLENEIAGFIGHYLKGIVIDDERLAVDEILKVGPLPGSYLKERHTRDWYRKEFLIPSLSNRDFFETWERGHTELQEKAKQKAAAILEAAESPVAPEIRQEILAHAEVRQVFKVSRLGTVAGCYVTDGLAQRNAEVRIIRNDVVIADARTLDSLKRFKDDAREVRAGMECGIKIAGYDDVKEGDVVEFYEQIEVARKL